MAVCESFRVSSLKELRYRGVLTVNCGGQSLILFHNGGRPCAVERPGESESTDQSHAVCPSTYLTLALSSAHIQPFALEIRGDEIWITVERPRYEQLLSQIRRFCLKLNNTLKALARELRPPNVDPIAPLRRSSRRVLPEICEGE